MWFDVGVKRYTTLGAKEEKDIELWFDVGVKRYTTQFHKGTIESMLWFDVGVKRYTTHLMIMLCGLGCGLM